MGSRNSQIHLIIPGKNHRATTLEEAATLPLRIYLPAPELSAHSDASLTDESLNSRSIIFTRNCHFGVGAATYCNPPQAPFPQSSLLVEDDWPELMVEPRRHLHHRAAYSCLEVTAARNVCV